MDASNHIINKANDIKLAILAYEEFSDIADYIWKSPRLIEHEHMTELKKLPIYFPNNPEMALERWHGESKKLKSTFPYMMNSGNLFATTSLYESYLLRLVHSIEKKTGVKINTMRGQGSSRINNYFKHVGLDYASVDLYHQVDAALKIRNCLIHASGILSWSKESNNLQQIVTSNIFLSKTHRESKRKNTDTHEVMIVKSNFGDRIQITDKYPWLACWYFRDYFVGLCIKARDMINKENLTNN
jgi:hypothetical protein